MYAIPKPEDTTHKHEHKRDHGKTLSVDAKACQQHKELRVERERTNERINECDPIYEVTMENLTSSHSPSLPYTINYLRYDSPDTHVQAQQDQISSFEEIPV